MNNTNKNVVFQPIISSIQKVQLYETKTKLYLLGSNNKETRFRVLIIDRTVHDKLNIEEDPNEMSAKDIRNFVASLGSTKRISAYGVIGFVRFLEGYYLILITKRTRCAFIGRHLIYTIKDTVMVRVNEGTHQKTPHPLEQRYLKMFTSIDLSSNFYFSYSYDLTRTLQYNLSAPRYVGLNVDIEKDEPLPDWGKLTNNIEEENEQVDYAFRSCSRKRFIWNAFLLGPMQNVMLKDWLLEITHGFISQSNISIFGRPVYICLIARRSTRFAGTRFLKRGANFMGDVANEVETEQIVMDGHRMCSFTQMRGSIPSHWSQDVSKMVPKPPISLDLADPYAQTSAKHFERLLFHYGSPIIILNLVKKRERRKHESILSKELVESVEYLNQFLSPQHRIQYIHFDMARKSRGVGNVMRSLANISEGVVQKTGIFFMNREQISFQTGIVRVNCVDCLDRTNTAQFAIGKCVLAHQLYELGFINPPKLEFDSDCVTMLENLYEEHGDTLALQYGGSQLVHRIKTYRKTAAWASQSNDIMQTISRYYSNTFSDTEKQHSINLFLGYYIPNKNDSKQNPAIWELQTDYYMHNYALQSNMSSTSEQLTNWIRPVVRSSLPYPCSDSHKVVKELFRVHSQDMDMIDSYSNFYLSFKLTSFSDHIDYQISQMARNFMRTFRTNFSPFQPGINREERPTTTNPSLTGQSSTSSTTGSTDSSLEEGSSSDEDSRGDKDFSRIDNQPNTYERRSLTFEDLFPLTEESYVKSPNKESMAIYKKYVQVEKSSSTSKIQDTSHRGIGGAVTVGTKLSKGLSWDPLNNFSSDSYLGVTPPVVSEKSAKIYADYVNSTFTVFGVPKTKDLDIIQRYLNFI